MQKQHIPILKVSVLGLIAVFIVVLATWNLFPEAKSQTLDNTSQEKVSAEELSAAVELQRQASANLTSSASFNQRFQQLSDIARKNGTVTAPVRARAAFRSEGQITPCITTVPPDRWRGEYFNDHQQGSNPLVVRDEGAAGFLSFYWGAGSPNAACGIGVDNFSASWKRTVNFAPGYYRFTVYVDGGARLYVDGVLRIDERFNQAGATYTSDVSLSAGAHDVKLEYYEYEGDAAATLLWQRMPPPSCPETCLFVEIGTTSVGPADFCAYPGSGCPAGAFNNGYGCCVIFH
jgi:PA14 domain